MTELNMVSAIQRALHTSLQQDPQVLILGEDVGINGGVFRATEGLQETFGADRVIDTPLAETAIAGVSIGLATQGFKPVAEIQFMGFIYSTLDQMINHAARLRTRTRGRLTCPMVLRAPYGGGIHAPEHHSESMEALFAHTPGIKLVIPSSPAKAYHLLLAAIADPDPVVFLEPKRLYRAVEEDIDVTGITIEKCFVERQGEDITLISWGAMMKETREAADILEQQGISVEVIDIATLKPLDRNAIVTSVSKTGRLVIIHEAPMTGGFAGEIAALVGDESFFHLLAPIKRVTGYDTIMPLPKMEHYYLPSVKRIVDEAIALMEYE